VRGAHAAALTQGPCTTNLPRRLRQTFDALARRACWPRVLACPSGAAGFSGLAGIS
jgi:hypothetical protein